MRKKDDEKQKRIKNAVMHLILEQGFAGTSISKIAREAGVSPATVYIYYENKEEMLKDIYIEYSEDVFGYLAERTQPEMSAAELIETLILSYYAYIQENREIFSFVEQFSQCPALACQCSGQSNICQLLSMIDLYKQRGQIRSCSIESIAAVLFSPVKSVAMDAHISEDMRQIRLREITSLIERALIL
jgi:AcrR family transcriptional regulator